MKPRAAICGAITGAMLLLAEATGLTALVPSGWAVEAAQNSPGNTATVLVIDGGIAGGQPVGFDLGRLRALPAIIVKTTTPWTDGENEFTGVRLRDLLDRLGAQGQEVVAAAVDDYAAIIPMEDVRDHDVIVAYAMNGEAMPPDNKGPLWILYPFSESHALQKDLYYARCVWQLTRLTVR